MTGYLKGNRDSNNFGISNQNSDYGLVLYGYNGSENNGATMYLSGKDATSNAGCFIIKASDGTNKPSLQGKPDGTLTWNSQNILTAGNYNTYALPLSGGVMTGNATIGFSYQWASIYSAYTNDAGSLTFRGGSDDNKGARVRLFGKNASNAQGYFQIQANDETNSKSLDGKPDGTLTWDGKEVERVNASGTNYIRYESGLQICWENLASSNPPEAVSFPVPFSSAPSVIVIPSSSVNTTGYTSKVGSVVSTGFTPVFTVAGGGTYASPNFRYIAIGYWK
jgi:hypothetical protein